MNTIVLWTITGTLPGLSHQAVSSVLGGGTDNKESVDNVGPGLKNICIRSKPTGIVTFASFSSSFSPGAVDVTLSKSRRDSAARFIASTIRTVALNKANTF